MCAAETRNHMDKLTEQYFRTKIEEIREKLEERHLLQEMARVATIGNFELCVYSGEGPVPHFHFKNTESGTEGCLKILEADYFKHGRYQAELNSKERKTIYEFLQKEDEESKGFAEKGTTNFKVVCYEWNKNNPENKIPLTSTVPDYANLKKKGTGH